MMQNLIGRIFFHEKVEFLKSGISFNFTLHQTKIHFLTHPVCHVGGFMYITAFLTYIFHHCHINLS